MNDSALLIETLRRIAKEDIDCPGEATCCMCQTNSIHDLNWAGKLAKEALEKLNIPLE